MKVTLVLSYLAASSFALTVRNSFTPSKYNSHDNGTPVEMFSAESSIDIGTVSSAAKKLKHKAKSYPVESDGDAPSATIYSDWAKFDKGSAYVWNADMDVDCDGIDFQCPGNQDGQGQTNFGALAAFAVPFIVIPDSFAQEHSDELQGNNIAAVICDRKMFYGIFGDTDGDSPQAIGEASWRMATACFPNDNLNGNNGHTDLDVTYIVFTGSDAVLDGVTDHYITDFSQLTSKGNDLVQSLMKNI